MVKLSFKKCLKALAYFWFVFFCFSISNCKNQTNESTRKVSASFYYWKSVFDISPFERKVMDSLNVNSLYIKFFDVGWDGLKFKPTPLAPIRIKNKDFFANSKYNIIPTVFITNETMYRLNLSQCKELANNMLSLIGGICKENKIENVHEIQIDCDWTGETKEKFFSIIDNLKELDSSFRYSATIRLHQIKYLEKTGVPPVSRGMLMAYNMGSLKNPEVKNSILEVEELKKYSSYIGNYPLPLDVALPLFEWAVIFRNGSYSGLIQNLEAEKLSQILSKLSNNKFEFKRDSIINGFQFKKFDVIRIEQSEYQEVLKASKIISKQLKNASLTVSFFHLDSAILKKYPTHELKSILNSFN